MARATMLRKSIVDDRDPAAHIESEEWQLGEIQAGIELDAGVEVSHVRDDVVKAPGDLSSHPAACDVLLCSLLVACQHSSQKPELRLHFRGIGHRIRDFLAKEFAVPLAKPVNRDFERSL